VGRVRRLPARNPRTDAPFTDSTCYEQGACRTTERRRLFSWTTLAEAGIILLTASILGFAFTGVTGKVFFRHPPVLDWEAGEPASSSPLLTFDEARDLYLRGALFIDARYGDDFIQGHVKGAINIPLQHFDELWPELEYIPRGKPIVTYCDGTGCSSSVELAAKLRTAGYANVKVFYGGWHDWVVHQQPKEP
jgi:rhodanese-related sulfurtransferase